MDSTYLCVDLTDLNKDATYPHMDSSYPHMFYGYVGLIKKFSHLLPKFVCEDIKNEIILSILSLGGYLEYPHWCPTVALASAASDTQSILSAVGHRSILSDAW